MDTTQTNFKTVQEAMDYITERYNFDPRKKEYPALSRLNKKQRLNFAVGHCLFHVLKSIPTLHRHVRNTSGGTDVKTPLAKTMVNIIVMAKECGIDGVFLEENPVDTGFFIEETFQSFLDKIGKIAETVEAIDHNKDVSFYKNDIKCIFDYVSAMAFRYCDENLLSFLSFLPSVMKSK